MKLLVVCCLFIPLVVGQVSWNNCGSPSNTIQLRNLTIDPYPIVAPGSVSIAMTVYAHENLTNPLRAILSLRKKVLLTTILIPCSNGMGSCTYEDLCAICTECRCPLPAGEHLLTLPITIERASWMLAGTYQGKIDLESKTGQKGCVQIQNIAVKS